MVRCNVVYKFRLRLNRSYANVRPLEQLLSSRRNQQSQRRTVFVVPESNCRKLNAGAGDTTAVVAAELWPVAETV